MGIINVIRARIQTRKAFCLICNSLARDDGFCCDDHAEQWFLDMAY